MKFRPIDATRSWDVHESGVRTLNQNDQEEIARLLMGRKVVRVESQHLVLDNGTVIRAIGNVGGCSCGAGDYDLSVLNTVDNIITRVDFDYHPDTNEYTVGGVTDAKICNPEQEDFTGHYRIFVFADAQQINLMQFDGSDGNGYYGTGFELLVRDVEAAS